MTYSPQPPNSGGTLVGTRDTIRGNFEIIQNRFNDNHVDFNDGAGKHKFLQMPEQASAPTTAADEAGFYAKVGTNPAQANLFFRGESDGYEYQLTKAIQAETATFGATDNGWTMLPGGLLMQYGIVTNPGTSGTVTFPFAYPSGNAPWSIFLQLRHASAGNESATVKQDVLPTSTNFQYRTTSSGASTRMYWMAIGN